MKRIIILLVCLSSITLNAYEPIHAVQVQEDGISFSVMSNGCTEKSHFTLKLLESMPSQIALERNVKDRCKMVAHQKWISFTYSELPISKGEGFRVKGETFHVDVTRQ